MHEPSRAAYNLRGEASKLSTATTPNRVHRGRIPRRPIVEQRRLLSAVLGLAVLANNTRVQCAINPTRAMQHFAPLLNVPRQPTRTPHTDRLMMAFGPGFALRPELIIAASCAPRRSFCYHNLRTYLLILDVDSSHCVQTNQPVSPHLRRGLVSLRAYCV